MKAIRCLFLATILGVTGALLVIYSGTYPIGADQAHNTITFWLLETLREHSVERAAAAIEAPNLEDVDMLLAGGADYNDMCAGCHLKPGKEHSDMSIGLYPQPPNLSEPTKHEAYDEQQSARQQFWVIKHGIKSSGMPAWGTTHDDQRIWAMVAFLQKLPELNAQQYQILTARNTGDH